jgi:serine/threonine protein kinase
MSRVVTANGHGVLPGTLSYWAPEIRLRTEPSSQFSDIWAVGCIGYEMCLGQQLSHHNNRLAIDNHIQGGPLDFAQIDSQRFGAEVKYIIGECLQWNPSQRCTAFQLREYIRNLFRSYGNPIFG